MTSKPSHSEVLRKTAPGIASAKDSEADRAAPPTGYTMPDAVFAAVTEHAFDSILIVDAAGKIAYANPACEFVLGHAPRQLVGKRLAGLLHPADAARVGAALRRLASAAPTSGCDGAQPLISTLEMRVLRHGGHWLPIESMLTRLDLPTPHCIMIHSRDLSARKRLAALMRGKIHLLEMIATAAPLERVLHELLAFIDTQEGGVKGAIALLAESAGQMPPPTQLLDLRHCIAPGLPPAFLPAFHHYADDAARALAGNGDECTELIASNIDTDPVWNGYRAQIAEAGLHACWTLAIRAQHAHLAGLVTLFSTTAHQPGEGERALAELAVEIAQVALEREQNLRQVRYLAHHDELTGLPNRVLLRSTLQDAITRAHNQQRLMALMFIDLDHFKKINDTLGHHTGDLLLQVVAARLHHCLRQEDSVARLGGDEFVITLNALNNPAEAAAIAAKVLASLSMPFSVENRELQIGASIGIGVFPDDGFDIDTLMRAADSAMYAAKSNGRNGYRFFAAGLDLTMRRHRKIGEEMQAALKRGEFSLQYQPLVEMGSTRVHAAEALLRWNTHDYAVAPAEFLPIAEENGLIVPIGNWVLREACQQLRRWRQAGFHDLKIAVNLSPGQLVQRDLPRMLQQLLRESGLRTCDLQLEIAEPTIAQPQPERLAALRALGASGIELSVDHFGTGSSSLPGLQSVPLHALKIDRSLVRGIGCEENNMAIIDAIIAMAHSLRLDVVAEGVETPEQAHFLRSHGCTAAQGFYFGRPASAEAFAGFLRRDDA